MSNEYLTKNATPRNSASPPTHAKPFTPTNCSQSIFGIGAGRGSKTGGDSVGSGRGGQETSGWGAAIVLGGEVGAGMAISGGFGTAESDSTGLGDSFTRFNSAISDSMSPSRWENSSMRFFALTARAISQIASAIEIPKINKMTSVPVF
ncbi:hypothetical protein [Candidatus Binatus sp.]|uniref:hypothetical protein n=1 Tax=Candidatus Binatus sp. TaxID=2811406 RepID=UPI003CC65E56